MFAIVNESRVAEAIEVLARGGLIGSVLVSLVLVYLILATHKLNCRLRVLEARLLEKEKFSTS